MSVFNDTMVYVRYADDTLITCNDHQDASHGLKFSSREHSNIKFVTEHQ